MDDHNRQVFHFQTTAKASADAHALARVGLAQLDIVVDAVALVAAVILLASGNVILGLLVLVVAGISLASGHVHPFQRALIGIRFRSLLGQATEVTVDDDGLRFENPLASSFIPWSSITAVRSNRATVAFFRDRVLLGYIPSEAFDSPAAQAKIAAFAQLRIVTTETPRT